MKRGGPSATIVVNSSRSKYAVVDRCARKLGWTVSKEEDYSGTQYWVLWSDLNMGPERLIRLRPFQRLNHFPGMHVAARKANLARMLNQMAEHCPEEYRDLYPQSFVLPEDWAAFQREFSDRSRRSKHTFIVKPSIGSQGRGIFLTKQLDDIDPRLAQVAQRYISNPLLIDGRKFDLRVYVLVLSCSPLRIYLHDNGLVRIATKKYKPPRSSNFGEATMHLTNYSVNKHAAGYEHNTEEGGDGEGSKRSVRWFFGYLRRQGKDVEKLWASIADIVIKTLLAAQPQLAHAYRAGAGVGSMGRSVPSRCCFEILGLDILLDSDLKPYLLEVNHSPSLTCDAPIDESIKSSVVGEAMALLGLRPSDKKRDKVLQAKASRSRLYAPVTTSTSGFLPSTPTSSSSSSSSSISTSTTPSSTREHEHRRHELRTATNYRRIFPPPGTEPEDDEADELQLFARSRKKRSGGVERKSSEGSVDEGGGEAGSGGEGKRGDDGLGEYRGVLTAKTVLYEKFASIASRLFSVIGQAPATSGAGSGRARKLAAAATSSPSSLPLTPRTKRRMEIGDEYEDGMGYDVEERKKSGGKGGVKKEKKEKKDVEEEVGVRPSTAPSFRGIRLLPGCPMADDDDGRGDGDGEVVSSTTTSRRHSHRHHHSSRVTTKERGRSSGAAVRRKDTGLERWDGKRPVIRTRSGVRMSSGLGPSPSPVYQSLSGRTHSSSKRHWSERSKVVTLTLDLNTRRRSSPLRTYRPPSSSSSSSSSYTTSPHPFPPTTSSSHRQSARGASTARSHLPYASSTTTGKTTPLSSSSTSRARLVAKLLGATEGHAAVRARRRKSAIPAVTTSARRPFWE